MKIDKLLHFMAGTIIGFALINMNLYYGFIVAVLISVSKEFVWDKWLKKGTFDWWDMFFGIVGTTLIFITRYNGLC